MKILIPSLLFLFFSQLLFAQTTQIPDPIFEAILISWGLDSGEPDGMVNTASIDTLTFLTTQGSDISDLTGIEDFAALEELNCSFNQLNSLDVSQNTALIHLNCRSNHLTNIDISQNINLREFSCIYNPIVSLDVSNNTNLEVLLCDNTPISSLNLSQNINLKRLVCSYTDLTELDINQNIALEELNYTNTSITNIDLSQNVALEILHCRNNQITDLDVSNNPALTTLVCQDNQLTILDLSQNTLLSKLDCSENSLTNLELDLNPVLVELDCSFNQLTCLNLKNGNNFTLASFNAVSNTNLTCIDVDDVYWSNNQWTSIDPNSSFSEQCNCIVGINNPEISLPNLEVSPNPSKGNIYIQIGEKREQINIKILNPLGQYITSKSYTNIESIELNLEITQGIYFLEISSDLGESETIKIIRE